MPSVTGMVTSRQVDPVRRWKTVTVRRPGARTSTPTRSPRITARGIDSSVTPSSSVPLHARSGCSSAAQPSGATSVTATRIASAPTPPARPTPSQRASRRRNRGASGSPSAARWRATDSAPSLPNVPVSATSMVPRIDPSRSDRSRSISVATPGSVTSR